MGSGQRSSQNSKAQIISDLEGSSNNNSNKQMMHHEEANDDEIHHEQIFQPNLKIQSQMSSPMPNVDEEQTVDSSVIASMKQVGILFDS